MEEIDVFFGLINDPICFEFGPKFYFLLLVPMILFPCLPFFSYLFLDYLNIFLFLFNLAIDFLAVSHFVIFRGYSRD